MTVETGYPDFEMTGFVQLMNEEGLSTILYLHPHGYNGTLGRNTYETVNIVSRTFCQHDWTAIYVTLGGIVGDIRQPNRYRLVCLNQPIG